MAFWDNCEYLKKYIDHVKYLLCLLRSESKIFVNQGDLLEVSSDFTRSYPSIYLRILSPWNIGKEIIPIYLFYSWENQD